MWKIFVKIYSKLPGFVRLKFENMLKKIDGGEMFSTCLRRIYSEIYDIQIGIGTYGCFNHLNIPKHIKIGRYCSFANNVSILPRREHPIEFASTHPIFFNSVIGFVETDKMEFQSLEIGNDVWIGQGAIICSKCTSIGNGAVIGAGCIVNKPIPPYAIVVGVPARVIKYRFETETIELLEKSRWYNLSPDELKKYVKYANEPKKFAEYIINDTNK